LHLDAGVVHSQSIAECVTAWRSHATLARQAGSNFDNVVSEIERFLNELGQAVVHVPYRTQVWMARSAS
jgi:hypothetical protein